MKHKEIGQNSDIQNAMWVCVLVPASGCITPICISEDSDTMLEKNRTQNIGTIMIPLFY
jgi:hypothetical protein